MTVLLRLPGDRRPTRYRAFVYGAFAHLYQMGQHVETVTAAQAEAGRIANDADIARAMREGC
jgi:hypothetical protein